MRQFRVVGQRISRPDGAVMATGGARYTVDLQLPGMLWGKILRSPFPHARIVRIDTSRAERLPGVRAVMTGQEILPRTFGPFADELALAIDMVRYIGEPVAAVAAVDEDTATAALDLIEVEYQPLPAIFNPDEAMAEGAQPIHAKGNISSRLTMGFGDVQQAFDQAHYVRSDIFQTSVQSHCAMEPHAALANFDPSGKLTIWTSNQAPHVKRRVLATTLGVPETNIRVMSVYVGGGFGYKAEMFACDFCAAVLSRKSGRPVKIVYDREEEFTATRQRHPMQIEITTGVQRDGRIMGRDCRVISDTGAYNSTGPMTIYLFGLFFVTIYRVPNVKYEALCVYTNNPTRGAQRGHGQLQECFASDSQLDIIAAELGIDPVEMRLINAVEAGDELPNKMRIQSCELKQCIQKAAARADWQAQKTNKQPYRGVGIACSNYIGGLYLGPNTVSGAIIQINEDGGATIMSGGQDIGQGFNNMLRQVAAEELWMPVEKVTVNSGDSDGPPDIGAYTSSATFVTGNAVRLAAADARQQLMEQAAIQLKVQVEELELIPGGVQLAGELETALTWERVAMRAFLKGVTVIGRGQFMPKVDPPRYGDQIVGQMTHSMSYGAQIAEVEVNPETGRVKVLRLTEAVDCGQAINPMEVEGQIHGSVSMSLGYGLLEETLMEDGQLLNPSFTDYKLPLATDMPPITSEEVQSENPDGPFHAKEAGETSVVPTATAIANAIYDAIGIRFKELPITPEKILQALAAKEKQ